MCGIFGFSGAPAPALLSAMAARLRHRGPDDEGSFAGPEVSLGADRLAIVGVVNGRQPLTTEDGSVVVVFNGEIYNFQELREGLERRGHRFATTTDGEVIAHLYEEEGEAAVSLLEGMFGFALWDERRHRLLLARDPLGMKPLFYARHAGRLVFASEIKALLCLPDFARRVDLGALDGLIRSGLAPADRTLFAGVRSLPPGHRLRWENGSATVDSYWRPCVRGVEEQGGDPVKELTARFFAAVGRHLVADVPVGACLSGGLDSSLVVAAMSQLSSSPIKTFSVGFTHEVDERPMARLVAEHCRTDHHEVTLDGEALLRALPFLIWHVEEPRLGPLLPHHVLFSHLAREVKVVLLGEGADELFGGYGRLKTTLGPLSYLPASMARAAYLGARHGGGRGQSPFLATTAGEVDAALGERRLDEVFRHRGTERAEALLAYEQSERLPKSQLLQVDRMSMAHSVEARLPYLDAEVVQFANRLPLRWKARWRGEKRILRQVARPFLPAAIWARPKYGLANPLRAWLASGFLDVARDYLAPEVVTRRGLFEAARLTRLLGRVERGRALPYHRHLLYLFVLIEVWHRVFIDPPAGALLPPPMPTALN